MNAREEILSAIRARRANPRTTDSRAAPRPAWHNVAPTDDFLPRFEQRARAAAAQVIILDTPDDIPAVIAGLLRSRNLPAVVHLPPDPMLDQISWSAAPGLSVVGEVPNGEEVAVNIAPYAIAETGTLVYPASPHRPASWHFRPGVEIALLAANNILATLEEALEHIANHGALPSTINLVTGPSRTGDIEQTLELGAHGPKELVIMIVPSFGSENA